MATFQAKVIGSGTMPIRKNASVNSGVIKRVNVGTVVTIQSGWSDKVSEKRKSSGKNVTITWWKVKHGNNWYYCASNRLQKIVVKPAAQPSQPSQAQHINYRTKSLESAYKVFPLAYQLKCKHGDGAYTINLIKQKHKINCSGSCSAVMRDCGLLSSGRLYHRSRVGGSVAKKKNTFSKAVGGNIKGLKNCTKVRICKKWKDIPQKYKVAGAFYVQDSNFFMYMGNGVFYNCNQSGKRYTSAKMYTKGKNSYCTNNIVLYAIIPNA